MKQEPEDNAVYVDEVYITETDDLPLKNCTSNWNTAATAEKKMWGVFNETGIFASACLHSFILWLADMVQSRELCIYFIIYPYFIANLFYRAKYPLSMDTKAMDTFGSCLLIGYNIGCIFTGTILSSSLGARFQASGSWTCVNAFYGYSHNHKCQCKNHPNNITGMGLEDLETLKWVFSSSNALVVVTQYASAYWQWMYIEMHFKQWDEDKYSNLATML